ncbi:hypothetical protein L3X38_042101 [Prunus dulcis]|uniref:Uncharacterized protein n=1 Tax=Prunus dulcis TaxID=3755 RepID=A0AAD4UVX6_PRUDU|nr:hypothetical protein L3X38_042101 [Prunus dulcis]
MPMNLNLGAQDELHSENMHFEDMPHVEVDNILQNNVAFDENMRCDKVPAINVQCDEPNSDNPTAPNKDKNILHGLDMTKLCNSSGDIIVGQASSYLIGQCIKSKYEGVSRVLRPHDIMEDMRKDMGVSISYVKAWRAREHALELVRGSAEESHMRLPSYCAMLEAKNTAGYEKWARVYFNVKRYNLMITNIAECLNSITRDAYAEGDEGPRELVGSETRLVEAGEEDGGVDEGLKEDVAGEG